MNTTIEEQNDGMTGLGILALMTVAFVASESMSRLGPIDAIDDATPAVLEAPVLIDLGPRNTKEAIGGAIRELRVIPLTIDSRIDLHWTPDDAVIEEYRDSGF